MSVEIPYFPESFFSNLIKVTPGEGERLNYEYTRLWYTGDYSRFDFLYNYSYEDIPDVAYHQVIFAPVADINGKIHKVFYHIFPFGEKFADTRNVSDMGETECYDPSHLDNISPDMIVRAEYYYDGETTLRGIPAYRWQSSIEKELKAYVSKDSNKFLRTTNQADDPGQTDYIDLEKREYSEDDIKRIFNIPSACKLPTDKKPTKEVILLTSKVLTVPSDLPAEELPARPQTIRDVLEKKTRF